jgi:hypothetical protein
VHPSVPLAPKSAGIAEASAGIEGVSEIAAAVDSAALLREAIHAADSVHLVKEATAFLVVPAVVQGVLWAATLARLLVGISAVFPAVVHQAVVDSAAAAVEVLGAHLASVFRLKKMLKLNVCLTFKAKARASTLSNTSTFQLRSVVAIL